MITCKDFDNYFENEDNFEELMDSLRNAVVKNRFVGDNELARTLFAEVYISIRKTLEGNHGPEAIEDIVPYFITSFKNLYIKKRENAKRHMPLDDNMAPIATKAEDPIHKIIDLLRTLKEHEYDLICSYYGVNMDRKSVKQIAKETETNESTIRQRLCRVREKIKESTIGQEVFKNYYFKD